MLRVLQLKIKLIVFSLVLASATVAQAAISVTSTGRADAYSVHIDAAGELTTAITDSKDPNYTKINSATTLIIATGTGVSLSETDVNTLLNTLVTNGTLKSLNLANAKCTYTATYDGKTNWEACLGSSKLQYLENFTYPKDMVYIPLIDGGDVKNLKRIIIPQKDADDNTKFVLPVGGFKSVANLEYLEINNNVDEIPANLCEELKKLTDVELRCPIKEIGSKAFCDCHSLKYLSLPEGLEVIDDNAFLECSIVGIRIPSTLTTIGNSAFQGCKYLEEIVIPENVKTIGSSAFLGCNSLTDVYVKSANTKICANSFNPDGFCTNISQNIPNDGNVNRNSYWNPGKDPSTNQNGQILLHIYDDKSNTANQDLIDEFKARYAGTKVLGGHKMYNITRKDADGNIIDYWPSVDDGKAVDAAIQYGAREYTETTLTLPTDELSYEDNAVSYKVDNDGNIVFYYMDGSTETTVSPSDIKIGSYDTTVSSENNTYTYISDVTPSESILYVNGNKISIEKQITVTKDAEGNAVVTTEFVYKTPWSTLDGDLTTNKLQINYIDVADVQLKDNVYTIGYFGNQINPETSDSRNWQRFVLYETYSSTDEWSVSNIIDDTWYTICVPFNVTRSQIQSAFGSSTEVCSFVGVKDVTISDNSTLDIEFTNDLMRASTATGSTAIIQADHAYMIHPSTHVESTGTGINPIFTITGISAPTSDELATRTPVATDGSSAEGYHAGYQFVGNYATDAKLSDYVGSYFLAVKTGERYPRFYRATSNSGKWSQYTAIVKSTAGSAKNMSIFFGDNAIDYDPMIIEGTGDATEVNEISVANSIAAKADSKVYNTQGVYVGNSLNGLTKGIYIVNGKKYVVR